MGTIRKLRDINSRYVRHIINNPYRYAVIGSKVMIQHARFQPEVHQLYEGCFLIHTPHRSLKNAINFILIYNRKDQDWWLVSNTIFKHESKIYDKHINSFVYVMALRYQIGELRNGMFFIPVINNSLQNAYYRLTDFILEYYGARNLLLQALNYRNLM